MNLSGDQKKVIKELFNWLSNNKDKQYITLGGYAGTGKSTIISVFRKLLADNFPKKHTVAFCSYTGRAVQILKNKLLENISLYKGDSVSTIHGLIYEPVINNKEEIIGWKKKESIPHNLIIVDEASMINMDIWADLLSYRIPIIAVGDHGQLPPIGDKFNLLEKPDLKLEKIHRQAIGNPIIEVSLYARKKGIIPVKKYNNKVIKYDKQNEDTPYIIEELLQSYTPDTLILCGYNFTRNKINQYIRNNLGIDYEEPQPHDRVICLRNNHTKNIYNGMLGTIKNIKSKAQDWYQAEILMDETNILYEGLIYKSQFGNLDPINFTKDRKLTKIGDLFDYGYALTVHKSQGSQAKKVILFEERFKKSDEETWKKWLYTGVTRAQEELYIIG